jgi:hypothetical protein
VQFSNAQAKIFDSETMNLIATGELGRYKMPRGKAIPVKFPVKFAYTALNSSDVTWWNMYNACQYQWNGVTRDVLNWRLEIKESIVGMVPHPTIATTLVGAVCPFNFSTSV